MAQAGHKQHVIGIDLGGTHIGGGIVDETGAVLAHVAEPTEAELGGGIVMQKIIAVAQSLLGELPEGVEQIAGIGVGTPGCVDPENGVVVSEAFNLPGWRGMALAGNLLEATGVPAYADNDVNVTALGETWFGAGRGVKDLLCITIGTGIGGGIVIGRKVHHGANFFAGEIGHTTVSLDGRPCLCGSIGCLEAYASAPAIARAAQELGTRGLAPRIVEAAGNPHEITAKDVASAAAAGDQAAIGIFLEVGRYLGAALANLVNVLNPEMIVIGGGVAQAGDVLFDPIRREIHRRALDVLTKHLQVLPAQLGEQAGLVGSAALALQHVV